MLQRTYMGRNTIGEFKTNSSETEVLLNGDNHVVKEQLFFQHILSEFFLNIPLETKGHHLWAYV